VSPAPSHLFRLRVCAFLVLAGVSVRAAQSEVFPSPAISGAPLLSVWRAEDYGAAPINWRVLQHPGSGFIYVANNFGVLEFDETK
jgi:hypothetical protein